MAFESVGNNAQWAVVAKVEATGGRYHASIALAITLKPRQDRINFGDQMGGALINTVAGTGDPHHKRIDSSMFECLIVLFRFTDRGAVVELAGQ